MIYMKPTWSVFLLLSLFISAVTSWATIPTLVTQIRTPHGGIQPQAVVDSNGGVHLIYFQGKASGGDIFYVRQKQGGETFTDPIPVNSEAGSAIATGTIRGAHLALGRNGRMHVAWNGAKPVAGASYKGVPMWYARLDDSGGRFEPQRNLITFAGGLDGGGSVAADAAGNVYVLWHGSAPDNSAGEPGRAVFIAKSADGGRTFSTEKAVSPKASGACGCCGMRAFTDRTGNLFALFRGASTMMDRDEVLMVSRNQGERFDVLNRSPWSIAACPMSSAAFCESKAGVFAAWETTGQIQFAAVDTATGLAGKPASPPGTAKRKHPAIASNHRGEVLLAWTEGTGWQRGGALAWQVFDASGKPIGEKGRVADGVPVWGLVAAIARPDGSFVIFH